MTAEKIKKLVAQMTLEEKAAIFRQDAERQLLLTGNF